MQRAFSCQHSVTHLLRRTIACAVFFCLLGARTATPETTLAKDKLSFKPILCESDANTKRETADCLQRFKELATRDGDELRLNMEGGKTKVYTDINGGCDPFKCAAFHLTAFYPSLQSFLVQKIVPECADNELVSRRSGSILHLAATVPELSPDGKYFVSIDQDELCERAYDLAIWSTSTDPPALELKRKAEAERYEYWTVLGWARDDRIKLKVWVHDLHKQPHESYDQDVEAVRSGKGWKLVWGKRVDRILQKPSLPTRTPGPPAYLTPH